MKIAISGAASVGKTTLALELWALGYPRRNVEARRLLQSLSHKRVSELTCAEYREFQIAYIAQKLEVDSRDGTFVTDRSFCDCYVYWKLSCAACSSKAQNDLVREICRVMTSRYDVHVYLPTNVIPFEDDGWRHSDPGYHARFDHELRRLYESWTVPLVRCDSADLESRVATVVDHVQSG